MKFNIDYEANYNWQEVTADDLMAYYQQNIENYPSFEDWIEDMFRMDLIRKNVT